MQFFPLFLNSADMSAVIVGGGEQAAQKARLLLKANPAMHIIAPTLNPELCALVENGAARHIGTSPEPGHFAKARLVFVATGDKDKDRKAAAMARSSGALVNVVDRPDLCDFLVPAIVDRAPVVVAIGTEGTAPVLARQIKSQIESLLEPSLGRLAAMAGRARAQVAQRIAPNRRRAFWEWIFRDMRALLARDTPHTDAETAIRDALEHRNPPEMAKASVSLIHPGTGDLDLMSLRAMQRLQTADVIFHDRDSNAILELARRDALRVLADSTGQPACWHEQYALRKAVSAMREGQQIVWMLPALNQMVIQACLDEGIDHELVPSVQTDAQYGQSPCLARTKER